MSVRVCQSVCLYICLYTCLSVCLYICVRLFVALPVITTVVMHHVTQVDRLTDVVVAQVQQIVSKLLVRLKHTGVHGH